MTDEGWRCKYVKTIRTVNVVHCMECVTKALRTCNAHSTELGKFACAFIKQYVRCANKTGTVLLKYFEVVTVNYSTYRTIQRTNITHLMSRMMALLESARMVAR